MYTFTQSKSAASPVTVLNSRACVVCLVKYSLAFRCLICRIIYVFVDFEDSECYCVPSVSVEWNK
jgi:hypothetical protein